MTIGYLVCPTHGDVFRDPVGPSINQVRAENMEPLLEGIARPVNGEQRLCPLCQRVLATQLRPD